MAVFHNAISYPETLPTGCVLEIVRLVRTGQLKERIPEAMLCAWNVQGYAQRMIFGDGAPLIGDENPDLTPEQAFEALEQVCLASGETGHLQFVSFDWRKILQYVLDLLAQLTG